MLTSSHKQTTFNSLIHRPTQPLRNPLLDPSCTIIDDDLVTLEVVGSLANVLLKLGELEEAKEAWGRVVRGYELMVGADHQDTLRTMGNLANVLNAQGETG